MKSIGSVLFYVVLLIVLSRTHSILYSSHQYDSHKFQNVKRMTQIIETGKFNITYLWKHDGYDLKDLRKEGVNLMHYQDVYKEQTSI